MGLSRFDVPIKQATGQEYFKLPINEMLGVLASKQKAQDERVQEVAQQDQLLNTLDDGYKTEGLADEIRQTYKPILSNLQNIDLTSSEGRNQLYQIKSKIANDPNIRLSLKDAAQKKAYSQLVEKNPDWVNSAINPEKDINTGQWRQAKDANGNWIDPKTYEDYVPNLFGFRDVDKLVADRGKELKANMIATFNSQNPQTEQADHIGQEDGKTFYYSKTGSKIRAIDQNDPAYKATLNTTTEDLFNKNIPEGEYFQRKNKQLGLPFDKDVVHNKVNSILSRFVFNETEIDNQIRPTGQNGSGKAKQPTDPQAYISPVITVSGENNQYKTVGEFHDYLNSAPANIDKSIVEEAKTYGIDLPGGKPVLDNTTGHKMLPIPDNATPVQKDQIKKFNVQLAADQDKYNAYNNANNVIMENAGLDPTKPLEEQISDPSTKEKVLNIKNEAKQAFIDYNDYEKGLVDAGQSKEEIKKYRSEFEERLSRSTDFRIKQEIKNDPNVKKYYDNITDFNKGIQQAGEFAIPLVPGVIEKFSPESTYASVGKLLGTVANYGTDKGVQLANSAGGKMTIEKARELALKFIADNKNNADAFKDKVFLTFNSLDNEPELYVHLPYEQDGIGLKIRQSAMAGTDLGALLYRAKPELYAGTIQSNLNSLYGGFEQTNGIESTLKPFYEGDVSASVHTNYQNKIRKVPEDHTYKDKSGKEINLVEGDKIFTLPEIKDVAFKPKTDMQLFDFYNYYNLLKNEGKLDQTSLIKLANDNNVDIINSPAIYKQFNTPQYAVPVPK